MVRKHIHMLLTLGAVSLLLSVAACGSRQTSKRSSWPGSSSHDITDPKNDKHFRESVVLINTTLSNGAPNFGTGFVVGWRDPELFVVTARHVVEDLAHNLKATHIDVMSSICAGSQPARVEYSARDMDLAVLVVKLPSKCITRMNRGDVRPLSRSELTYSAWERAHTRLHILARSGAATLEWTRDVKVRNWGDGSRSPIVLDTSKVAVMYSGSPLMSEDGGIVGMVLQMSGNSAKALNYNAINQRLQENSIPTNMAGDYATVRLKLAPSEAEFWVNGTRMRASRSHELPLGSTEVEISKEGYLSAHKTVSLRPECWILEATLPSRSDKTFRKMRTPMWLGFALSVAASTAMLSMVYREQKLFFEDPSRAHKDRMGMYNALLLGTGLITATVGVGAVTAEVALQPNLKPEIKELRPCGT